VVPARRIVCLLALLVFAGVGSGPAAASEAFADFDVTEITLAVNARGEALVTYRRSVGSPRRVLVWGAVNARHPSPSVPQVRFSHDYSGGWRKYRRAVWKTFGNRCRPYDGPPLQYLVSACKAPDGSYWALQRWIRREALLGFPPFRPEHTRYELHLSHWTGPLPVLEASPNWTYGTTVGVFGRLTYLGQPHYGFGTTSTGNPRDRYGRNVYIDTFNSAYGPGWKRESGILLHRGTGTFCHSFVPQLPFAGYPSRELRPAAPGERYRFTIMGPGVTPVIQAEARGLPAFSAEDPEHRALEAHFNSLFDRLMAGDRLCAHER
jgi:hypothetical protein